MPPRLSLFTPVAIAASIFLGAGLFASPAHALACPDKPLAAPPGLVETRFSAEPQNLGELQRTLLNYKCFGDYDRDVAAVIGDADAFIQAQAPNTKKPAVVLDIDETSLSNWPALLANDFGLILDGPCPLPFQGACGLRAWQLAAKDEAIAPTLQLFRTAKAKGITMFFVTGRLDRPDLRAATEANLRSAGYDGWAALIMRPVGSKLDTIADYKAPARAKIEAEGYAIIANIGDQESDLAGGHATRAFKVPNPFYYLP